MNELQTEQAKLNQLVEKNRGSVAVILEGRDTAGKTGTIRTVTQYLNPAWFSVCLSSKPSKWQMNNWLHSWDNKLPAKNQVVFYDRSWYSRALVQAVNGWCSEKQYSNFMRQVTSQLPLKPVWPVTNTFLFLYTFPYIYYLPHFPRNFSTIPNFL